MIDSEKIPAHVAVIMDGNGRWARKRNLPRMAGHNAGMLAMKEIVKASSVLGVKHLTVYAFSTENWRRPKAEIDFLMNLPGQFVARELGTMQANNIRLRILGDLEGLPEHTRASVQEGMAATAGNTGLTLSFALNYGGREEILRAARLLAETCCRGELKPARIDAQLFESCLYTAGMPGLDLVIRTSGELRLSNFLLWQLAYAELTFIDTLWPDFAEKHLCQAIAEFQQRQRRFGGL